MGLVLRANLHDGHTRGYTALYTFIITQHMAGGSDRELKTGRHSKEFNIKAKNVETYKRQRKGMSPYVSFFTQRSPEKQQDNNKKVFFFFYVVVFASVQLCHDGCEMDAMWRTCRQCWSLFALTRW